MKKLARKKWESDDPAVHQREPQNLENSGTFEIIRQEEVEFIKWRRFNSFVWHFVTYDWSVSQM